MLTACMEGWERCLKYRRVWSWTSLPLRSFASLFFVGDGWRNVYVGDVRKTLAGKTLPGTDYNSRRCLTLVAGPSCHYTTVRIDELANEIIRWTGCRR